MKLLVLLFIGSLLTGAWLVAWPDTALRDMKSAVHNPESNNPVELGAVHWLRDLAAGTAEAERTGKPMLILFQEVPGCSNCTRYGSVTLSHPLIVEAIESHFVPVCIYNNKGGKDAEALKKFNEQAWNNPVVRIVGKDYSALSPRIFDFRSSAVLVTGMLQAMRARGLEAPAYLELLEEELLAREATLETATFSMYCFWSGEKTFGAIPGVIETAPGFQDGREVVRVVYNPAKVTKAELEKQTQPNGITACTKNEGFRNDREPKYYLAQSPWKYVPMTSLQACRANSLVGNGKSPEPVLSPRQRELYQTIRANPKRKWKNAIGAADMVEAWAATEVKQ
ncbi:MAG: thioredoxin family protein [Lewinellaceae bacterium]|nr:thioredoxin family protein [Lewinellaceae bacterium]MCB9332145.1 thioredoxin family protein [Lewinellaceae bacterium]